MSSWNLFAISEDKIAIIVGEVSIVWSFIFKRFQADETNQSCHQAHEQQGPEPRVQDPTNKKGMGKGGGKNYNENHKQQWNDKRNYELDRPGAETEIEDETKRRKKDTAQKEEANGKQEGRGLTVPLEETPAGSRAKNEGDVSRDSIEQERGGKAGLSHDQVQEVAPIQVNGRGPDVPRFPNPQDNRNGEVSCFSCRG